MMKPTLPPFDIIRRTAETIAIGAVGGVAFQLAGFPAGLVSGSIVTTATAALLGRGLVVPAGLTRVLLVVVGIALGSVVSPETLRGIATYPLSVAVLAVSIVCMTLATMTYLRLVHGWNALSALLGASPGALAQVVALTAESGADVRAIVVVQTLRVVMLALGIPAALALVGYAAPPPVVRAVAGADTSLVELAMLVIVSVISAFGFFRIGFQGGWLFGAMVGSATLTGAGLVQAHLPWWVANAAMISMGAVTGSRFGSLSPRVLVTYMMTAIGSFTVAITVAACFMTIAGRLVGAAPANLVMAFSPGAQDTMMLLALALNLDPVFVGAHHLARYVIVSLGVSFFASYLMRRMGTDAPEERD
jgi:membrane AbrB-like protein